MSSQHYKLALYCSSLDRRQELNLRVKRLTKEDLYLLEDDTSKDVEPSKRVSILNNLL